MKLSKSLRLTKRIFTFSMTSKPLPKLPKIGLLDDIVESFTEKLLHFSTGPFCEFIIIGSSTISLDNFHFKIFPSFPHDTTIYKSASI
jgi:hypothetical protein